MIQWAMRLMCFTGVILAVLTVSGCIHADMGNMR